jgi:oligosaccharide reducing-end xylanase
MKRRVNISATAVVLAAVLATGCQAPVAPKGAAKKNPNDGDGAFATGHYRNLFVEAGHSPKEVRRKVDAAFQQLFHGDPTNQAVYFSVGDNLNGPLAYITDIKHHDVRTEGLSYGMMIAVQLNRKAEFDALWNWSNT